MKKLIHPCKKDCPNRSSTCHSKCDLYKEFEKRKDEEYRSRKIEIDSRPIYKKKGWYI